MLIMKNTLEQMGYNYQELGDEKISVSMGYHQMVIDGNAGMITYDSDDVAGLNKIKQAYMVEFYREQAIQEGNQVQTEVQDDGSIDIYLSN